MKAGAIKRVVLDASVAVAWCFPNESTPFTEGARAVSDRQTWLEEWCPECGAAPGARCRRSRLFGRRAEQLSFLHAARGWRGRSCPGCKAESGGVCRTPSGREASRTHAGRLRPARDELVRGWEVWEELARGASVSTSERPRTTTDQHRQRRDPRRCCRRPQPDRATQREDDHPHSSIRTQRRQEPPVPREVGVRWTPGGVLRQKRRRSMASRWPR